MADATVEEQAGADGWGAQVGGAFRTFRKCAESRNRLGALKIRIGTTNCSIAALEVLVMAT